MAPIAKRRRLSPEVEDAPAPAQYGTSSEEKMDDFYRNAAGWHLEQDYENRPRNLKKKKEENRLPIKTADGWVEQAPALVEQKEEDADSFLGSGDEAEAVDEDSDDDEEQEAPEVPQISAREQILLAKENLAHVASMISEDPEENIGLLKKLQVHATSRNKTVVKLCLATQLAIYRDIIPGYRIRPVSKEELKQKLSKDVRKLRNFEQSLVSGYHEYVKSLTKETASVATVAISCACTLLNTVPHFNFRGELINILVGRLSVRQVNQDFHNAVESLETLFRDDEDGNASREAVDLLCKMMKSRSYNIHESALNTFLHLRLLSEFAHKGSNSRIDKDSDDPANRLKQKREFRNKKERKRLREVKGVEKELQEADAVVSHEERDKNQSDMLKLVFVAYFRILKQRVPQLMGAVLEGLARYAHLINQDFFGDILEALRELVMSTEAAEEMLAQEDDDAATAPRNINRESLLCIITAFALLQGQDVVKSVGSLHLDLEFFITHLYKTLLPSSMNPDLELSAKSLRLRDPDGNDDAALLPQQAKHKINVQTTTVLLLRSLSSVLLPPQNLRSVPPLRLAAFAKQLLTISLQLPEKSCLAMMGLLQQVAKVQGKKIAALWYTEERKGDGVFDPLREEVEGSNPFATTVWEGELLRKHFCPQVRESIVALEKGVVASRL
jgi:nucleolar complex protein 3